MSHGREDRRLLVGKEREVSFRLVRELLLQWEVLVVLLIVLVAYPALQQQCEAWEEGGKGEVRGQPMGTSGWLVRCVEERERV